MIRKCLIANRGEIACRIIKTAKRMGIATVAVYSTADRQARHVQMADEAWLIGEAAAKDSYLRGDKIVTVARDSGADAIHPGYGFLAENAEFAQRCADANLIFVGPSATAIASMGSKSKAKAIMAAAGVPLLPGFHENDDDKALERAANDIGFPVLLKAVAGGGGKGMRIVREASEFAQALAAARREADAAFGNPAMLVEKYLDAPRHVELQIVADARGQVVHLYDRDCSVQRRYQKVIEEAPAPGLSASLRESMAAAAISAARAIEYCGAGTIEFLVDDDQFYFMEMNTRLQVEHPVTEMITGIDLVEWQFRVASGEPLPRTQEEIQCRGHSIEARVYAEDPDNEYLPTTGTVSSLQLPGNSDALRIDHGLLVGDIVGIDYDPMLAKVTAWGDNRNSACERLQAALGHSSVGGITTNIGFLHAVVGTDRFRQADLSTGFLDHPLTPQVELATEAVRAAAACALWWCQSRTSADNYWLSRDSWQANLPPTQRLQWTEHGEKIAMQLRLHPQTGDPIAAMLDDAGESEFPIKVRVTTEGFLFEYDQRTWPVEVLKNGDHLVVLIGGRRLDIELVKSAQREALDSGPADSRLLAPMSARVLEINTKAGQSVVAGQTLVVLEAMKMEQTLRAPADGQVVTCSVTAGDLVSSGDLLVELKYPDPKETVDE